MRAATVDVRPIEEHVEAMTSADSLLTLCGAYAQACAEGAAPLTVGDVRCGSVEEPLLLTIEQLFAHLRRELRRDHKPQHRGMVLPASREDGGRGPALAGPPR